MCGSCGCNPLGACLGDMTYTIERLTMYVTSVAVVSCIIFTVVIMLGTGVGLGYNFCYVETKLNATVSQAKKGHTLRRTAGGNASVLRGNDDQKRWHLDARRGLRKLRKRRSKETLPLSKKPTPEYEEYDEYNQTAYAPKSISVIDESIDNELPKETTLKFQPVIKMKPTLVVPLRHSRLIELVEKLQKIHRNFTLELITETT